MKTLLALPFAALIIASEQVSAACVYIQNTYSGILPADSEIIVQGPFTITGANGCQKANITSTITALGVGTPPSQFIDRLDGSTWTEVDGGNRSNVSTLGELGSYRVRLKNDQNVARGYSGTTRYGR
ncbi:hypothetical protein CRX42_03205 [Pseudomonas jessenii]|uniref:Adhesin n=1 Tax=Pseudomonas jessenii TaxID=77298 RepID=A0A2W0F619_PSEJE|nr:MULTISPECIES: hypothetical protein [Pseudomonas]PYY72001.1 hypothetical protein CRX42_03205 [Pseudomonas jessenii]WPN28839.1 hypothetical protein QMK54_23890 [Pseudomonas sp. P5_109]